MHYDGRREGVRDLRAFNARVTRVGLIIGGVCVAVAAGAGAYAFGPTGGDGTATSRAASSSVDTSGASASSAPAPSSTATATGATPSSVTPAPSATSKRPTTATTPAGCPQGERHQEVETLLARIEGYGPVTVDGRQSVGDCTAIKKFQNRFGISPANGRAGGTTADVARRIAQSLTPAEQARCAPGGGLTACVDLTQQTMWVVRDGAVIFGPTVVRTGMRGFATPVGSYRINYRTQREWSVPYEVWLPYWQRFVGGIGFHATTTYLHNGPIGSHGCVNLLHADAVKLWSTIGNGTAVRTFGRRPGT